MIPSLRPGETIFGKSFDLGFGGKGANQAVAARYCGADVVMVAKVGNDLFGEATVKNFASLGIDTTHVRIVEGVSSGVAPIFVEPNGQNRIIVVKGANDTLVPADVDAAANALQNVDAIILQFEIPLDTVYYTVQFARKHKIRCIVNPAPALPARISELIEADYFVPNETEAEVITALPVHTLEEAKTCGVVVVAEGFSESNFDARRAGLFNHERRYGGVDSAIHSHTKRHDGSRRRIHRELFCVSGGRIAGEGRVVTR